MMVVRGRTGTRIAALLTVAGVGLALAGCGAAQPPMAGSRKRPGVASVAASGSLQYLNVRTLGAAFTKSTGYAFQNRSADGLAEAGSSKHAPNVLENVGPMPAQIAGQKVSRWSVQYAATSMVIAYNPRTPYGARLAAIAHNPSLLPSLFTLLQEPGLRLGRTDPNADPQGLAFIEMLELAQRQYHLPADAVSKILRGSPSAATGSQIYNPYMLVPRLQAGRLDAISAFRSEAVQLHLRYIPLPSTINLGSPARAPLYRTVSVQLADGTVVHGQPLLVSIAMVGRPDPAALAFVSFVLSPGGLALHYQGGFKIFHLTVTADASAVPRPIRNELDSS